MTSNKPYLIRALYEWIVDNALTPYLLVNADSQGCVVPTEHVKDGKIVFNITMDVVHNLLLTNQVIEFKARFSGVSRQVYIPIGAVLAIYAKENGEGMSFPEESFIDDTPPPSPVREKPNLKIVK